jgi:uncharacterized Zn-finger protein
VQSLSKRIQRKRKFEGAYANSYRREAVQVYLPGLYSQLQGIWTSQRPSSHSFQTQVTIQFLIKYSYRPFICEICTKKFARASSLKKHITNFHSDEGKGSFTNSNNLINQVTTNELAIDYFRFVKLKLYKLKFDRKY